MSPICKAFGIARSNLINRLQGNVKPRGPYCKASDAPVLAEIKEIVGSRMTYGYPRVTAILNRKQSVGVINHKRVYRIMGANGLLLQKHTGRKTLKHEGEVITLRSNLRWCSDAFEIKCWNGEKVFVAFSLDCCDREAISFVAKRTHLVSEDIQHLMASTVEKRFGPVSCAPTRVQWLSDNGPIYVANATRCVGAELGLEVCTTPAYSPESNGMAEALVKTFKRDYVYINDVTNADVVIAQIKSWFEDYNEFAPHSGLGMKSPREFRRQVSN